MKFILNKQIKYYTRKIIRILILIAIALGIITTVTYFNYKVVYQVSIAGEQVGYIQDKEALETKIQEMANDKQGNIAFIDIDVSPEYQLTLLNKQIELNEKEILAKVEESKKVTYKYYAVTLDGEQKSIVNSLEEAEEIVASMKEEYEESVKFTIGVHEIYTENQEEYTTEEVKVATSNIAEELQEIEDASVNGVYLAQKPISGTITSRFGSRESIRNHAHTGLDIAAPYGTEIKAAAEGTVIWSGYRGSYGNLVIVDCGNGVNIYYGHCSKLYVKEGEKVNAGDCIGAVGSTGNSTGNHLHFEIRVNGSQVNPQNYIYK